MDGLSIPSDLVDSMRALAGTAYPEECCGFLLSADPAQSTDVVRPIVGIDPAENRSEAGRRRRFVILPEELRAAEQRAATDTRVVSGFYHSHPDHPARPSEFDQEHAWPWYAYVILSSARGASSPAIGAFELDPDSREFREIGLAVVSAPLVAGARAAPVRSTRE
jgi:proteasome lid subunit RPN8/RPN11